MAEESQRSINNMALRVRRAKISAVMAAWRGDGVN
jgi:hypothetical protein